MLPTLYYTSDLHDHVRTRWQTVGYVLDEIGWEWGPVYEIWFTLGNAVCDTLWEVNRYEHEMRYRAQGTHMCVAEV